MPGRPYHVLLFVRRCSSLPCLICHLPIRPCVLHTQVHISYPHTPCWCFGVYYVMSCYGFFPAVPSPAVPFSALLQCPGHLPRTNPRRWPHPPPPTTHHVLIPDSKGHTTDPTNAARLRMPQTWQARPAASRTLRPRPPPTRHPRTDDHDLCLHDGSPPRVLARRGRDAWRSSSIDVRPLPPTCLPSYLPSSTASQHKNTTCPGRRTPDPRGPLRPFDEHHCPQLHASRRSHQHDDNPDRHDAPDVRHHPINRSSQARPPSPPLTRPSSPRPLPMSRSSTSRKTAASPPPTAQALSHQTAFVLNPFPPSQSSSRTHRRISAGRITRQTPFASCAASIRYSHRIIISDSVSHDLFRPWLSLPLRHPTSSPSWVPTARAPVLSENEGPQAGPRTHTAYCLLVRQNSLIYSTFVPMVEQRHSVYTSVILT